MAPRWRVAILAAVALAAGGTDASAKPPPAPVASTEPRGAIVVALGDDAASAARSLAVAVYKDKDLKPSIDDATARVLAGEAVPEQGLTPERLARLRELASLRKSLAPVAPPPVQSPAPAPTPPDAPRAEEAPAGPPADTVARRILAGIGAETRATLVVTVAVRDQKPSARALRVATASWEPVEIGATVQTAPDGAVSYAWPGATETLRAMVPPPRATSRSGASPAPATRTGGRAAGPSPFATPGADGTKKSSFWSSPWFWVALGGVVATGVTVFVIAREADDDDGVVRVRGTVPQ